MLEADRHNDQVIDYRQGQTSVEDDAWPFGHKAEILAQRNHVRRTIDKRSADLVVRVLEVTDIR